MKFRFLFLILLLMSASAAQALEADQYRLWQQDFPPIEDSTAAANDFLNQQLQDFLQKKADRRSWQKPEACLAVSHGFLHHIRPNFFKDRLKKFVLKDLKGAAVPQKQKLFYDFRHSMFKDAVWPFIMPVAQTVKINGVYLGTDKIDHFFASGQRYLNSYRRGLKKGLTHQDALKRAVLYGVSWPEETGVLGYWSAQAFSFADLEANYQGMQLGIDMCRGPHALLQYDAEHGWRQAHPIRLQNYVSPLWDESFNNSFYLKQRAKHVQEYLRSNVCELAKNSRPVQKLWQTYQRRLDAMPEDFHIGYVRGLILSGDIPDPKTQSLHTACGFAPGFLEGPSVWQTPHY